MQFDPFNWIEQNLNPADCNTVDFIYDHMESQSGRSLAGIYLPFDPADIDHYSDRGAALEFLVATGGGRVLDFGPGDGWPSLIIAPYVDHVTGVDGSVKRVEVCSENARRMGITNADFIHVAPRRPLPFEDGSFDSVVASTSVENTPDPRRSLAELHRVLRPGGRLRLRYEAMSRYRGGREHELWLCENEHGPQNLVVMKRLPDEECAVQYNLRIDGSTEQVEGIFSACESEVRFEGLTETVLESLRPGVGFCAVCRTHHPSGKTWVAWMREIGFAEIVPTGSGNAAGRRLFEMLEKATRPSDLAELDRLLLPLVMEAVEERADPGEDPPLTAVKQRNRADLF